MSKLNKRALVLVLTGLVSAIAAAAVVYYMITNIQPAAPQTVTVVATQTPMKVVVVAATDIAANSIITNSQVVTGTFPENMVPADALTSLDQVVNTTARTPVFSGQILLQRQFLAAQGRTGASVNIPAGKVLVAFPSTDMLNATGAVQAGDHVNIMLSMPISGTNRLDGGSASGSQFVAGAQAMVSQMTLQNIEVYTLGLWTPPGEQAQNDNGNALKIITFIVDPQEALILKFVKDSGGTIDLAVRSAEDANIAQTDPVNLDYLVDLYGFIGIFSPTSGATQP